MDDLRQDARTLVEMALVALSHAFGNIEDGDVPMLPFVMTDSLREGRAIYRFESDSLDHALDSAQLWLERADAEVSRYAFAWDGYITLDDGQWDALFVEAGDRLLPYGMLLCQRYVPSPLGSGPSRRVGEPMLVERLDSRLCEPLTRH